MNCLQCQAPLTVIGRDAALFRPVFAPCESCTGESPTKVCMHHAVEFSGKPIMFVTQDTCQVCAERRTS